MEEDLGGWSCLDMLNLRYLSKSILLTGIGSDGIDVRGADDAHPGPAVVLHTHADTDGDPSNDPHDEHDSKHDPGNRGAPTQEKSSAFTQNSH